MIKIATWNRLNLGKMVAARLPSSGSNLQAWVGVYSFRPDQLSSIYTLRKENLRSPDKINSPWVYQVTTFEVDTKWIENDWDISEKELINRTWYTAYSDEELVQVLQRLNIDLESLDSPWKSDYPL